MMVNHYCPFTDTTIDADGRKYTIMFVRVCPKEGCDYSRVTADPGAWLYCPEHKADLVSAGFGSSYRQDYDDELQDGECCKRCRDTGLYPGAYGGPREPAEAPVVEQLGFDL